MFGRYVKILKNILECVWTEVLDGRFQAIECVLKYYSLFNQFVKDLCFLFLLIT